MPPTRTLRSRWRRIARNVLVVATLLGAACGTRAVGPGPGKGSEVSEAEALYRQGRFRDAFALAFSEARVRGDRGALGLLAATIASLEPTKRWADKLGREADASPHDPLKSFAAGLAAHYYGHLRAQPGEDKRRWYERALHHLHRSRAAYGEAPRLWIYLAVSYRRVGRQQEAEAAIERAVRDAGQDADAFYCRAEVYHRTDAAKARDDIGRYIAIMEDNKRKGSFYSESKEKRVAELHALFADVAAGRAPLPQGDPFDLPPLVRPPEVEEDAPGFPSERSWLPTVLVVVAVVLALVAGVLFVRRRRRDP